MVALAGWWNTPTFSPIGVLSAFYDGDLLVSHAQDWAKDLMDSHWLPVISASKTISNQISSQSQLG
jgi:hypothetical protein